MQTVEELIPVYEPLVGQRELEYLTECVRTGWISSAGQFIEDFEGRWAEYCDMKYGVAVSNGTVALQIALSCLDLHPGDEVIMPAFTIISCAQAITYNGAVPVLVDSDPRTWCMNVDQVRARITSRARAIMAVHIYGHPVDMDPLLDLARKYDLAIIEDAAEAHGAEYKGRRCGGLGDLSCFSFYANKIITTGEGGMVLTNDPVVAKKLRSLRNLCFQKERRFYHTELGHNFRLTNLQAAIGLAQLERIEQFLAHKRWMAKTYTDRLKSLTELQLPVEEVWARNSYWMYAVVLDESAGMDALMLASKLADYGVMTRPFFLGIHRQPVFQQMGLFGNERYPVADRIAQQGLYLPSGLTLSESLIDQVCDSLFKVLTGKGMV
jgi:perosamine synthetase